MMYTFHTALHVRPESATRVEAVEVAGHRFHPIDASRDIARPFPVSFEDVAAALERFQRMIIEPDGSFVWTGDEGEQRWQVEGNLYDRAGKLLYVELWGNCPAAAFDQLLGALGWPRTEILFQLVHEAIYLDETDFRRRARRV